jgi:hypothetical protein
MAQRVQVLLVDDLDGSTATQTVTFALDGVTYEIDLADYNASSLRDAVTPWIRAGRKVSGRAIRGTARGRRPVDGDTAKVRGWARSQGYTVSDRGRVSAEIRQAYQDANR